MEPSLGSCRLADEKLLFYEGNRSVPAEPSLGSCELAHEKLLFYERNRSVPAETTLGSCNSGTYPKDTKNMCTFIVLGRKTH